MPHYSPSFMKTVNQHFPKSVLPFSAKPSENVSMVYEAARPESEMHHANLCKVVAELVEIVDQSPYCTSNYFAKFLN